MKKMKRATLKALKESIVKWERRLKGWQGSIFSENCPLCKRFSIECKRTNYKGEIELCPLVSCYDGLWRRIERHIREEVGHNCGYGTNAKNCLKCRSLIKDYLVYLRSHLPKGKT